MKGPKIIKIVLASILIGAGVFLSIMLPKTTAIFSPDFISSVAIGVGLVASGVLVFLVKRTRVVHFILSLLLLWSLLLNAVLLSTIKDFVVQINTNTESNK